MKKWIKDGGKSFFSALTAHRGGSQEADDAGGDSDPEFPSNTSGSINSQPKKMTAGSRVLVPSTTKQTKSQFEDYLNQSAVSVLEGDLMKRKGRGIGKAWVRQHFVLRKDALYYGPCTGFTYKEKKIALSRVHIGSAEHYTNKENAFGVLDSSSKSLHVMSAESERSMIEWVKTLIAVQVALENRHPEIPSLPNLLKKHTAKQSAAQDSLQDQDEMILKTNRECNRSTDHLTDSSEDETFTRPSVSKNVERGDLEGLQEALFNLDLSKAYAFIDEGVDPALLDFGRVPTMLYEKELIAMKKMGFMDQNRNCLVLLQCKGKLDAAVKLCNLAQH
ncbi:hypothetical protein GUITHDRAFT_139468 [Guillardia theta CCMP2712]|uniref:PH domain-containing protein n=1 Tax=Guillardia theta (strain CCMP2712) TaxID=905079 RepID=L1J9S8_GUITC|nr:hypothetical protein GUITHDRAFT_139468 [Guillardia theta CCMP2712]EKX44854.1 hypothetical protein GUITHDRAFT_139468 [Guillardia theta CCMP2712]|eukprot:XP_005831834.1 hypothetical protein GUITHDRAFT_139468 [Guillardia theta CCMP2712]